ncbi:MAG: hypothetical protein QOE45_1373 [Frankiaceae bacterium]|jgi:hypothetical protein|nr:hypothetical protein [Frankiaceae bacterium]
MPGRRRLRVLAGAAALVAALAGAWFFLHTPRLLGPGRSETESGLSKSRVGDWLNVSFHGFEPHGSDPVHVRGVRVTGLPRGLRVVGLHAFEGPASIGAETGDLQKKYPGVFEYRPVTEMVFRAGQPEEWSLLVIVEATEPGDWHTTGIDVDWTAGRHRGTTHYGYKVAMTVQP